MPLKLADERLGLTGPVAGALPDKRHALKVKHSLLSVMQQRVFGIGNGYVDANDAARLRSDRTLQLLQVRIPGVGSKPALSRPSPGWRMPARIGVQVAGEAVTGTVLKRHQRRLCKGGKRIIIDVDATWGTVHGEQQGTLFAQLLNSL